jgi:uncharacterized RDD family membrane protein YckC
LVQKQSPLLFHSGLGPVREWNGQRKPAGRIRRGGREESVLSKSASTATSFPAWKQEVNRRVAAHMSRKTTFASESTPAHDGRLTHDSRAAQAAARVAERYAHAPSYSELLADEARNAMRAAEAASKAAQQAHAAVQHVLDGLEAAGAPEWVPQPGFDASNASQESPHSQLLDQRSPFSAANRAEQARRLAELEDDRDASPSSGASEATFEESSADDTGVPIYANLLQFPRPMVATRRMRPRRAEGPLADTPAQPQLSIFEVDPGSISTEAAPEADELAAPGWMRAEESPSKFELQPMERLREEAAPRTKQGSIKLAPLNRRLMALVVDASLTLTAFLSFALPIVSRAGHLPGPRAVEATAAFALLFVVAAYQALFVALTRATPGMRYAGIALCTFEGQLPSREQRCMRLAALVLSVLPLGLGLVWALFDEDRLMGHDRLSKTYLRRR